MPRDDSWDTVAEAERAGFGLPRDVERTRTGLLLMAIGFGLGWIPYVSIVGGLLAFIGIIFFWIGRRGFGSRHHEYVLAGCLCVLVALLVAFAAGIWIAASVASAVAPAGQSLQGLGNAIRNALEGFIVAAVVAGVLGSLGYLLLPYALADRTSRALLWGGSALSITISALLYAVLWPQLSSAIGQATSGTTFNAAPVQDLELRETLFGALQFFPDMMFLVAYLRVRRRAANEPPGTLRSPGNGPAPVPLG
jgi:hypothetical protein